MAKTQKTQSTKVIEEAGVSSKKVAKMLGLNAKASKPKKIKQKRLRRINIFSKIRSRIFDSNEKQAEKLGKFADEVLELEGKISKMSQDEMRAEVQKLKTEFQKKLSPQDKLFTEKGRAWLDTKQGAEILDLILEKLPMCFALLREASDRMAKHRHFRVQLMAGIALAQGRIIEFKTGEGKTLVGPLALFVYSLFGRGSYLVTVNDYLAKRDAEWNGYILDYLGISTGVVNQDRSYKFVNPDILHNYKKGEELEMAMKFDWSSYNRMKGYCLVEVTKKEAYLCDVTYGTHSEFGFDYLRDNRQKTFEAMNQREPFFCVVDEVDSILIDEARTPLIISSEAEESNQLYIKFARLVKELNTEDYTVDEKERSVILTDAGIIKVEKMLGVENLWEHFDYAKHLDRALIAEYYYKKDDHYIVHNDEVVIVDEFTGRLQPGRRWSDGIHQAIEAKEGVNIKRESRTVATVTYQNYFRLYPVLSGMTGTALTEAEEFGKIYNLEVVEIPTNRPMIRIDEDDLIYKNEDAKFAAIVKDIKENNAKGIPILVGTISVEKSEKLSALLRQAGIKHEVLNAKNHAREADIVARAGEKGSVTISTNMAGRGTDIKLGQDVKDLGGLYVIGTERHESRRIDNQLRGRSGRQGDPGRSRFYLALDDEIMRIYGGDIIKTLMSAANVPDDMPFQSRFITRAIKSAQKKVEAENFDARKNNVDYDDVLHKQRLVIYNRRKRIMELFEEAKKAYSKEKGMLDVEIKTEGIPYGEIRLRDYIVNKLKKQIELIVDKETNEERLSEKNIEDVMQNILKIVPRNLLESVIKKKFETDISKFLEFLNENPVKTRIKEQTNLLVDELYDAKELEEGFHTMREIEKYAMLEGIDVHWIDHLEDMEDIRHNSGLQSYGQKDPLNTYQNDGYAMFTQMMDEVDGELSERILLYTAKAERTARVEESAATAKSAARSAQEALEEAFKTAQSLKEANSKKKSKRRK